MPELETFGRRFAIGLSFAGDNRDFVEPLALALKDRFGSEKIFDFLARQPELVGANGLEKLLKIYSEECFLVVPVFSRQYPTKRWCREEWQRIRTAMQGVRQDHLIPIEYQKCKIPDWGDNDISFPAAGKTPEELADLLYATYEDRVLKYRKILAETKTAQAGQQSDPMKAFRTASNLQTFSQLRPKLINTLSHAPLRRLVLQANELGLEMSAESLSDAILAVVPAKREPRDRWSPLCYVYRTVEQMEENDATATTAVEPAVIDGLERLTSLLLPVSVEDIRSEDLQRAVNAVPDILRVAGAERMVGASIAGRMLGLQVWLNSDGRKKVRDAVHPNRDKSQIPLGGIGGKGLVDAVREQLAEVLKPHSSNLHDVQAALTGWAGREAFVCVWLMDTAAESQIGELRRLFPELILLVCDGTSEGHVNPQILYRLQEIENFIASHRGQRP